MSNKQIEVRSKSLRNLLDGIKYTIDTYQREYNWTSKEIAELLEDLATRFLDEYEEKDERSQVENYPHYFLGSIIVSPRSGKSLIVDGQQRLISLTLLLIYLNNLQKELGHGDQVNVDNLIFSERYGKKSFNLDISGLTEHINALYQRRLSKNLQQSRLVTDVLARYNDIEEFFPEKLKGSALPYFIDWVKENVDFVEITTHSDEEAYIIFETMNDRGLNLSQIDLLKSYLLSKITNSAEREEANRLWRKRVLDLIAIDESEPRFLRSWFYAKYVDWPDETDSESSDKIRSKIETTLHKWVREEAHRIGLRTSSNVRDFIMRNFDFFTTQYIRIRQASFRPTHGLEEVYYCYCAGHPLRVWAEWFLFAPLNLEDDCDTIDRKIRLVAQYLDIVNVYRNVNQRIIPRDQPFPSTSLVKEIRSLDIPALASVLKNKVDNIALTFEGMQTLSLIAPNRRFIRYLLARITAYIEKQSGVESTFETYYSQAIDKPFEIEHLWANKYERHKDEFPDKIKFEAHRNRIGGLVLLPQGFNQSLNDAPYDEKVKAYFGQNLLARSLNELCYQNNPSFLNYMKHSGHPFKPYPTKFEKADFDERAELYKRIAEEIWNPTIFDSELSR